MSRSLKENVIVIVCKSNRSRCYLEVEASAVTGLACHSIKNKLLSSVDTGHTKVERH